MFYCANNISFKTYTDIQTSTTITIKTKGINRFYKMSVYLSKYKCNASLVNGENPLPIFRDSKTNFEVINSETVPKEFSRLLGYECGKRVYPYKKQDRYDRKCNQAELKSIVLENDFLKATFLPTLGGRLISLFDKENNKELLFANENIQMGNLAIRDAWFSGGIEWNIGQYGHALTTSGDVFVSVQKDLEGNDFLRIYEFERMHEIYWHIDFHLPKNSKILYIKVKIYNLNQKDTSLYCWTNVALRKTDFTRVFSNTKNALFLNPFLKDNKKGYDYISLPFVDKLPNLDISYPKRFPYSNEYFFACNKNELPYEATVEENGDVFLDFSTNELGYRKMFCWGEQQGGKHWESFLSPSTTGEYFEAQAGVAPSQLHGEILPGLSSFSFTQAFCGISVDSQIAQDKDYDLAFNYIKEQVKKVAINNDINELNEKFELYSQIKPDRILHKGSGFGYFDKTIKNLQLPAAFKFDVDTIKNEQKIFLSLLNNNSLDLDYENLEFDYPSISYQKLLENNNTNFTKYLNACIECEKLNYDKALKDFIALEKVNSNSLVCRNIAFIYKIKNDLENCYKWYEKALSNKNTKNYLYILEEYSNILLKNNELSKAKEILYKVDNNFLSISDNLLLDLAFLSAKFNDLDNLEFCLFNREIANIREGENPFPYLYYEYLTLKLAKDRKIEVNDTLRAQVKAKYKIPYKFDFTVLLEK